MAEAIRVGDEYKEKWDEFIKKSPNGHILQSWEWGEFREKWGTPPVRIAVFDDNEIKAACSFTLHRVPLINKFVGYCGKGPVFDDVQYLELLLTEVKNVAREKNSIFIKFEPNITADPDNFFHNILHKSKKDIFAAQTFELDLTKSEEDLMNSFHPKWRYNIRLAEKKGVTVEVGQNEAALHEFLQLQRETASRDNFFSHPDSYYETQWNIFHPLGLAHILTAKVDGKPAASWWLFTFGDYLYYPYGSSSYEFRSFMPSQALMWQAIKFGQARGLRKFDLWGAAKIIKTTEREPSPSVSAPEQKEAEENVLADPKDPWAGFTKFKLGFNPEYRQFIGPYDLILSKPLYHTFQTADKIRWLILRTLK